MRIILISLVLAIMVSCSNPNSPKTTLSPVNPPQENIYSNTTPVVSYKTPVYEPSSSLISLEIGKDSVASYSVMEQLLRLSAPNAAIGKTKEVTGSIIFNQTGDIQPGSNMSVNADSLTSDESRRDRYLRDKSLESKMFPKITFTIVESSSIPWPLPSEGTFSFQLIGQLTIRDVSKTVEWDTIATFSKADIQGTATTTITFEEFEIQKPSLAFILSVDDEIALTLEFYISHE
ncbi:YceI family protein [SAR202 cluster bacterium AC-409-J13_OGT_754m]|nr:YceI family protein [SAR202 cluster bacterium AC-409-J13_OGT_754m]